MIEYKGIKWRFYHGALVPAIAPHVEIKLTKEEEKELLKKSGAYFLRYVSMWDRAEGSKFWYVIKDYFGGMDELSSNTRSKVRRGLKNCLVKIVDKSYISLSGYEVYKKATQNYKNFMVIGKNKFEEHILSSNNEFWAVFEKGTGKLIAYSQNIKEDNSINYSTIKFDPDYLKLYPSYALFYTMNRYYLNEKGVLYVNDGSRSLSHATNIQDFLIQKFKFRKAYCKLHIIYRRDIFLILKLLYPVRSIFILFNNKIFQKISVLLKHEEIRKSYE